MNIELSPARATFVKRLYDAYHLVTPGGDPRDFNAMRTAAAPHIRALADRASVMEPEDFRKESERFSHEYPAFGFSGLNGQMFVNQLVYAARDAERSDDLAELLGKSLAMPPDITAAFDAIGHFVDFVEELKQQVTKYGALAIWRVPYLLSYFWEAGDLDRFPIAYPSTWTGFERLGFAASGRWGTPPEAYELVCSLIAQVRQIVGIGTWEVEHFLIWLKEMPFAGIDPGSFDKLARNREINETHLPKVGYPDPVLGAEARNNIDDVLRQLKSLQAAIKTDVAKLFTGNLRVTAMGERVTFDNTGAYHGEAWVYFLSRLWGWAEPSLQIGMTPLSFYWGFHLGITNKTPAPSWAKAADSFRGAEAAGARRYAVGFDTEAVEVQDFDAPEIRNTRGGFVGWVVPRDDLSIQNPSLARRCAHYPKRAWATAESAATMRAGFAMLGHLTCRPARVRRWDVYRILVPLDTSEASLRAIPWADALAGPAKARVVLARSIDAHDAEPHPAGESADDLLELNAMAEQSLVEAGKLFEQVRPELRVMPAKPDEIASMAREEAIDLIVMATPERTHAGSGTGEVVAASGLPVLSVGPNVPAERASAPHTILLTNDGSDLSRMIVPALVPLAQALGAQVILFRALETVETLALQGALIPLENPFHPQTADVTQDMEALANELRDQGLAVEVAAGFGSAARAILEAADQEGADLIALATHSRSGLAHWMLGSVAESVLTEASVPVFVFHPREVAAQKKSP